jgi:RNA polymerase sigma-70 factor, ECF subfamily
MKTMTTIHESSTTLTRDLARDLDRHFDEVVTGYQRQLFVFAYGMSGCSQDAEEVVQDVFVRAHRALKSYEADRIRGLALQAWLFRICLNLTRNRHRKKQVQTVELLGDGPIGGVKSDPTADEYRKIEDAREMQEMLLGLPNRYRSAVLLRHVNELSYPEIAAALDQPEGTVKSNVHRGVEMLRRRLSAAQEESNE